MVANKVNFAINQRSACAQDAHAQSQPAQPNPRLLLACHGWRIELILLRETGVRMMVG